MLEPASFPSEPDFVTSDEQAVSSFDGHDHASGWLDIRDRLVNIHFGCDRHT
jgi:hypothetical protein